MWGFKINTKHTILLSLEYILILQSKNAHSGEPEINTYCHCEWTICSGGSSVHLFLQGRLGYTPGNRFQQDVNPVQVFSSQLLLDRSPHHKTKQTGTCSVVVGLSDTHSVLPYCLMIQHRHCSPVVFYGGQLFFYYSIIELQIKHGWNNYAD